MSGSKSFPKSLVLKDTVAEVEVEVEVEVLVVMCPLLWQVFLNPCPLFLISHHFHNETNRN